MHACIGQELAAGRDLGEDDGGPLFGLVPVAVQAVLQAGARPDPDDPAVGSIAPDQNLVAPRQVIGARAAPAGP